MDDKKPEDEHDFSDFDDFLDDDLDQDLLADLPDEMSEEEGVPDGGAMPAEGGGEDTSDPDGEVGASSPDDDHSDIEGEEVQSPGEDELLPDDELLEDDSGAVDEAPLPTEDGDLVDEMPLPADEGDLVDEAQLLAEDDDLLGDHESEVAESGGTPESVAQETSTDDDTDEDVLVEDDELPDIHFPDEDAAADEGDETSGGDPVDESVEELENFDDFIIDDASPAEDEATDAFAADVALDSDGGGAVSTPAQTEPEGAVDDGWVDEDDAGNGESSQGDSGSNEEERIVPDELAEQDEQTDVDEEDSMKSNMIALIAGAVALVASMGGLWLGYSAKAELASLPATTSGGGDALSEARLKAMDERLGQLEGRLSKLATQLASVGAMAGEDSGQRIDELGTRTDRLEQLARDLKEQIGHINSRISNRAQVAPRRSAPPRKRVSRPVTKPNPKSAIAHSSGSWFVNLTSHSSQKAANKQIRQMKKLGFTAESKRVLVKGRIFFRVRVPGFASKRKAQEFRKMLASRYKITDSWVSNY